jgi:hypothetical protein
LENYAKSFSTLGDLLQPQTNNTEVY